MFKNYLKIAWRNLLKHKLFSALNIFGLATSMSVCLLLIMILVDQYSYDKFHEHGDRIYRVISNKKEKSEAIKIPELATTSLGLAASLNEDFSFVEQSTRLVSVDDHFQIADKTLNTESPGYAVDAAFLDIFSFGWMEGDQGTALSNPYSIVLTDLYEFIGGSFLEKIQRNWHPKSGWRQQERHHCPIPRRVCANCFPLAIGCFDIARNFTPCFSRT